MPPSIEHHQPPAFFIRGPSPLARFTFFVVVSIALMAVDARLHYLTEIRQGCAALLHPLEIVANAPVAVYHRVQNYFSVQRDLTNDNRAMHELVLQQSAALQRLQAVQSENEHLRSLLGAAQSITKPTKLAEILHVARDPFTRKIIINLGARQGVMAGQAAVDELGVIGQVTRTYPFSSEVTLVTDKDLAVPVQVERNGLRAIAFGNGRDEALELPYLPVNVDIREGDVLVTSGIDGVYPLGLMVAKITRVERNVDSPFAHIVCIPTGGTGSHRQVLILAAQSPQLSSAEMEAGNSPPQKKSDRQRAHHATRKP